MLGRDVARAQEDHVHALDGPAVRQHQHLVLHLHDLFFLRGREGGRKEREGGGEEGKGGGQGFRYIWDFARRQHAGRPAGTHLDALPAVDAAGVAKEVGPAGDELALGQVKAGAGEPVLQAHGPEAAVDEEVHDEVDESVGALPEHELGGGGVG